MFDFLRRRTQPSSKLLQPAFHPSSYADPQGRVFLAEGGLFRAITADGASFCSQLLDTGVVATLVERRLLVPTRRATQPAPAGYALVLEHERVPHVSYPFEWPGEMLRAAALHTLTLLEELAANRLTLKDAHGWNIVFDGCRPVFVDFGSITTAPTTGHWLRYVEEQFREYFLHPLELIAAGHGRVTRALMRDFEKGIGVEEYQRLLGAEPVPLGQSFAWYRERITGLKLQQISQGWAGYYDGEFPALQECAEWTPKHRAVHGVLQRFRPATVLDIGANRGWYAMLAASTGSRVVAFDNDEVCVELLFADARKAGLTVQPLVMSCVNPSPRYGLAGGVMESAEERLQSDLVLALALVHHMVFRMNLRFEQIAAALAAYTRQVLVVEFPPKDDIHVSQWMTERYAWYTMENFTAALSGHFSRITTVASHPTPRVLLVCER